MNSESFIQALYEHGVAALKRIREARPHDRFYSFAFYTSGDFGYAFLTAASYEGLEEAVASNLNFKASWYSPKDPMELHQSLKWSPCDSPLHDLCQDIPGELESEIAAVSEELFAIFSSDVDDPSEADAFASRVELMFIDALRRLDNDGHFGSPDERGGIVLNLLKGDQSNERRLRFASLLNPPETVSRFATELGLHYEQ